MKKILILISVIFFVIFSFFASCTKDDLKDAIDNTKPTVTTKTVSGISPISAVCGGEITNTNNISILFRGVIYSSDTSKDPELPKISNFTKANLDSLMTMGMLSLADSAGLNYSTSFKLLPNRTYKIRAFVISALGTSYGNVLSFNTTQFGDGSNLATVTTGAVSEIAKNSAVGSGTIVASNGTVVTKGVCWSLNSGLQTIDDVSLFSVAAKGSTDNFTSNIKGLLSGTTYYVKAFAVNESGIAYGEELEFTTLSSK